MERFQRLVCTFKAKETARFASFWFIKAADEGARRIGSVQKSLGD